MNGTQSRMRERSRIMLRFVLAAAVAVAALPLAQADAAQFNLNVNVGPKGPAITNFGPRSPNFDRPRGGPDSGGPGASDNSSNPKPTVERERRIKKEKPANTGGNTNAAGMPP